MEEQAKRKYKPKLLEDEELVQRIEELTLQKKAIQTELKKLKNRFNARIWKAKHLV